MCECLGERWEGEKGERGGRMGETDGTTGKVEDYFHFQPTNQLLTHDAHTHTHTCTHPHAHIHSLRNLASLPLSPLPPPHTHPPLHHSIQAQPSATCKPHPRYSRSSSPRSVKPHRVAMMQPSAELQVGVPLLSFGLLTVFSAFEATPFTD